MTIYSLITTVCAIITAICWLGILYLHTKLPIIISNWWYGFKIKRGWYKPKGGYSLKTYGESNLPKNRKGTTLDIYHGAEE